jgi:hypothetical protein
MIFMRRYPAPGTAFSAKAVLAGSVLAVALHQGTAWAFAHLLQQGSMVSYNEPLHLIGTFTFISILFFSAWFGGMSAAKLSGAAPILHAFSVGVILTVSLLFFGDRSGFGFPITSPIALGASVLEPYIQCARRIRLGPVRPILSWGAVSKLFAFAGFGALYFCWKAPWKPAVEILRSGILSALFGLLAMMARSIEQTVLQRYRDLSAALILGHADPSGAHSLDESGMSGSKPTSTMPPNGASPPPPTAQQPEKSFFLYLRPFAITGLLSTANPEHAPGPMVPRAYTQPKVIDFESRLAAAIESLGPLVALGHPGEQFGAGRILSPDDGWKQDFESLARRAKAILIIPSNTPGTVWEIDWLVQGGLISKCIFVMPPLPTEHLLSQMPEMWAEASRVLSEKGIAVPAYSPNGALFRVGKNGAVSWRENIGQRSNRQLRRELKDLVNEDKHPRSKGTRHVKWVIISALTVLLAVWVATLTGQPDSGRLRVATSLNSSLGIVGTTGTVRLNPHDDRVLEVTGEWVDEAEAHGFVAGFGPGHFDKFGFRSIQFRQKAGGDILQTYDVIFRSWTPPPSQ